VHQGFWHLCLACHQAGDGIELIEARTSVPTEQLVELLRQQNSIQFDAASLERYLELRLRQQQAEQLWINARRVVPAVRSMEYAVRRLAGNGPWHEAGGIIGGADEGELLKLFPGLDLGKKPRSRANIPVQPLYDLPGRIAAFRIEILRGAKSEWITARLFRGDSCLFLFLDQLLKQPADMYVLMDDPKTATEMLLRGTAGNCQFPLIATETPLEASRLVSSWFPGQRFQFWAENDLASAFAAASECGSKVYLAKTDRDAVETIRHGHAVDTIWRWNMRLSASPGEIISKLALDGKYTEIEPLLQRISNRREFLAKIGLQSGQETELAVRRAISLLGLEEAPFQVEGKTVLARGGRWLVGNEVIFDGQICLRETLHQSLTGKTWYVGSIRDGEADVAFTAEKEMFDKDPFGYASQVLVTAGRPMPAIRNSWRSKAMNLILSLGRPTTRLIPTVAGWDSNDRSFLLRSCRIRAGGEVVKLDLPVGAIATGTKVEPGTYFNPRLLGSLSVSAWAAVISTVHAIVVGARSHEPAGCTVFGRGAEVFIQAANAAGCETRKVGDAVPSGGGSWPVVVDLREDRKGRGFVDPANVLAVGTDVQSLATAINRGWSWAEVYAASPVDAETAVCIDSAVGEVIRRYAKQEMGKSTICSTPWTIEQTKALVRDFCASVDIELPKVRIRNFSTSRKEAVEALLAVLVGQPDFQVVSAGRQNENTGVVVDDTSAWIDRDRLREALVDRKANHVTDAAIEEVLRDNDLLLDQPRLTGGVGWLTKIDWFKSATSSHRAKIAAIT
jgi:hypothetical protein